MFDENPSEVSQFKEDVGKLSAEADAKRAITKMKALRKKAAEEQAQKDLQSEKDSVIKAA